MHPIRGKFKDIVSEEFDLEIEPREFEKKTKTAADPDEAVGCGITQIAKSMAMKAGKGL